MLLLIWEMAYFSDPAEMGFDFSDGETEMKVICPER